MIKHFLTAIIMFFVMTSFTACTNGDTTNTQVTSYDVGGDLYVQNGDGTITIINTETGETTTTELPYDPDNYPGPDVDKKTCNALGFFWCPIDEKCLNQPIDEGECPDEDK